MGRFITGAQWLGKGDIKKCLYVFVTSNPTAEHGRNKALPVIGMACFRQKYSKFELVALAETVRNEGFERIKGGFRLRAGRLNEDC